LLTPQGAGAVMPRRFILGSARKRFFLKKEAKTLGLA